jgi:trans-2-enoyl-CoA reductase
LTELADFLKSLGATEVVTEEAAQGYQFKSIIEKLGKPKLALNGVGGKSSLSLLRTLGEGGLMVTYGGMSRQPVTVTTAMFVFNNIRVVGFSLVKWLQENSAQARDEVVNDVIELAQSGHLKPVMHTPWRLEDFKMAVSQAMKPRQTSKQIFLN